MFTDNTEFIDLPFHIHIYYYIDIYFTSLYLEIGRCLSLVLRANGAVAYEAAFNGTLNGL